MCSAHTVNPLLFGFRLFSWRFRRCGFLTGKAAGEDAVEPAIITTAPFFTNGNRIAFKSKI